MPKPKVLLKHLHHQEAQQIGLYFSYNTKLIEAVKRIEGARWSRSNRCWCVKNNRDNLKNIFTELKNIAPIDRGNFFDSTPNKNVLETKQKKPIKNTPIEYTNLLKRRRYSENTIKTYQYYFSRFINHFPTLQISELSEDHIRKYQDYLVNDKKVSLSTQNQAINAIKFYYEHVLQGERKTYYIERPRKEKRLPQVLNEKQVHVLIQVTENPKHKALFILLYSAGLRIGELINMRKQDIDFDKNITFVRKGKGKRDRTTILAKSAAISVNEYLKIHKPNYWLFEGPGRKQYSDSSINNVIKASPMQFEFGLNHQ